MDNEFKQTRSQRVPKPLIKLHTLASVIAFFGLVVSAGVNMAFGFRATKGPLEPDAARGIVIPYHDHNVIHYVNQSFDSWSSVAVAAQLLFIVLFMIVVGSFLIRQSGS